MITAVFQRRHAWAVVTVLLTLLAVAIPHWLSPGYYFDDDVRHYFMVSIHEIGGRLLQGEWPILSLRSAYSGNLLGEGQFGLFNPLTLLLYAAVSRISDLGLGALFYASCHLSATALGVYCVARLAKISPPLATLAGFSFVITGMNSYWYSSSWWNAMTTNTWLVWAVAAWMATLEDRRYLVLAVLASAATLGGGWPHGSVTLVLTITGLALHQAWLQGSRVPVFLLCLGGTAALLASLPALTPLAAHVLESSRGEAATFHNGIMTATLDGLLALSWPSYLPAGQNYFGQRIYQPHFYAAWFILPFLVIYARTFPACSANKGSSFRVLIGLTAVFAIMSLGPEQIGPLRWPLRFLPYYHLFALLSVIKLVDSQPAPSSSSVPAGAVWLLGFLLCWQQQPNDILTHGTFALLGFLATRATLSMRSTQSLAGTAIAMSILLFAAIHYQWPRNDNVGHWQTPTTGHYQTEANGANGNTLILQQRVEDLPDWWRHFPSGNVAQWENRSFINGYSPIEPRALKQLLCFNAWSWSCPRAIAEIFATDPTTGKDLAALFKIGEVRVTNGPLARAMESLGPQHDFHQEERSAYGTIWRRRLPILAGTVSHASAGIEVSSNSPPTPERESLTVRNTATTPGRLIWARTPFRGYEARLNGQPVLVETYADILLSVVIPAGQEGQLELDYHPFGWRWTYAAAILGMILAVVGSLHQPKKAYTT